MRAPKTSARSGCPSGAGPGQAGAGSTDLRGLLSFHPYLDGPSSEVRFFTHDRAPLLLSASEDESVRLWCCSAAYCAAPSELFGK